MLVKNDNYVCSIIGFYGFQQFCTFVQIFIIINYKSLTCFENKLLFEATDFALLIYC